MDRTQFGRESPQAQNAQKQVTFEPDETQSNVDILENACQKTKNDQNERSVIVPFQIQKKAQGHFEILEGAGYRQTKGLL